MGPSMCGAPFGDPNSPKIGDFNGYPPGQVSRGAPLFRLPVRICRKPSSEGVPRRIVFLLTPKARLRLVQDACKRAGKPGPRIRSRPKPRDANSRPRHNPEQGASRNGGLAFAPKSDVRPAARRRGAYVATRPVLEV